jgi:hypothetical protein
MTADQFIRLGSHTYCVHAIRYFYWAKKRDSDEYGSGWWVKFVDGRGDFYEPEDAPQLQMIQDEMNTQVREHVAAQRREREAERKEVENSRRSYAAIREFVETTGIPVRALNSMRRFTSDRPDHPLAVGLKESPPDFRVWAEAVLAATEMPKIRQMGPKSWAALREKLTEYLAGLEVQP